jgi:hypothetical protein
MKKKKTDMLQGMLDLLILRHSAPCCLRWAA